MGSGEVLFVVDQGDVVGEGCVVVDVKGQGDEFSDGLCIGKKVFYSVSSNSCLVVSSFIRAGIDFHLCFLRYSQLA